MNVPELFIRRPVMTTLVMSGILLFGLIGYRLLPVSDLPSVDYPTIQISASLPGANPDTMASSVATPLEKQFSIIAGVDSMSSVSSLGSVQITIQFALDLLEQKHVLVAPGVSFNVPYRNHFRVTTLPDPTMLRVVFARIEELLAAYESADGEATVARVVDAQTRFK